MRDVRPTSAGRTTVYAINYSLSEWPMPSLYIPRDAGLTLYATRLNASGRNG